MAVRSTLQFVEVRRFPVGRVLTIDTRSASGLGERAHAAARVGAATGQLHKGFVGPASHARVKSRRKGTFTVLKRKTMILAIISYGILTALTVIRALGG